MAAVNDCFIYFAALAETRHRGAVPDLFECLPSDLPTDCDNDAALRIHNVVTEFIEKCPGHPNVGPAFRILLHLHASDDLKSYLLAKLKFFYAQGDAHTVYQLHALQPTAAGRRGCNRRVSWPPSLSLGRSL